MKLEPVTGAYSAEADISADEATCCSLEGTSPDGSYSDTNNSAFGSSHTEEVSSFFLCL